MTNMHFKIYCLFLQNNMRVISKRIPGRHNDDSATVTHWFINFYHLIMEERFGRVTHARR